MNRATRRIVGLSTIACAIGGCAESPRAMPRIEQTEAAQISAPERTARAFLGELAKHDFAAAEARFDETMKAQMPAAALGAFFTTLETNGAWEGILASGTKKMGNVDVVIVSAGFGDSRQALRVAIDGAGRVAGLFHVSGAEAAEIDARAFIDALVSGKTHGAEVMLEASARAEVSEDLLEKAWSLVETSEGRFDRIEHARVEDHGVAMTEFLRARFAKEEALLTVDFGKRGKIAGFHLLPASADVEWTPPPYADATAFFESEILIEYAPRLPGTLTLPHGDGPFPIVVFVHGSGPNDRDETSSANSANKIFKDIAWGLASLGVASIRYEKVTRVDPRHPAPTEKEEVVDPALAAVSTALRTSKADPNRIVILGHSQGGYLAPRIAKENPRIAGVITMAGPTHALEDLLVEQSTYFASLNPGNTRLTDEIEAVKRFRSLVRDPSLKPDTIVEIPPGAKATGAYFLYVRGYRPEETAKDVARPFLILQGERDYQVPKEQLNEWKSALSGRADVTFHLYPSLNHHFMTGEGVPRPAEYAKLGHVDARVIEDVANWVKGLR